MQSSGSGEARRGWGVGILERGCSGSREISATLLPPRTNVKNHDARSAAMEERVGCFVFFFHFNAFSFFWLIRVFHKFL